MKRTGPCLMELTVEMSKLWSKKQQEGRNWGILASWICDHHHSSSLPPPNKVGNRIQAPWCLHPPTSLQAHIYPTIIKLLPELWSPLNIAMTSQRELINGLLLFPFVTSSPLSCIRWWRWQHLKDSFQWVGKSGWYSHRSTDPILCEFRKLSCWFFVFVF